MSKKRAIAALAFVALVIMVAAGAAIVPAGTASNQQSSGNQLAGSWVATVNLPAPLPPLTSLQVYTDDGSFVEYGSDSSGAARSPQFGRWERIGGRLYAGSGTFFRFNPLTGAHVGSRKINRSMRLSDDGRGLAVDQLRVRAGLLDASDEELAEALFSSGVSTAKAVSQISGRGVGMDLIRSSVRKLGGDARIVFTASPAHGHRPFELLLSLPTTATYG